jgi:SOS response associated peptidase (SRAP)
LAQRSARHQFPIGGLAFSDGPLPGGGITLLRVHRPQVEMEVHQGGRGSGLLRRALAPDAQRAEEAFTLLTTEPGPDVAPIHDQQMVVLDSADWLAWFDLARPESDLMRPLPGGSLAVEQVR